MTQKAVPVELRMDAYYYGFNKTGNHAIDKILSAVACAGKSYHLTEDWHDEASPYPGHVGRTPIEWIQNAANEAAAKLAAPVDGGRADVLEEAAKNDERYKFMRMIAIADEPEQSRLIALLAAADNDPDTPERFDIAIDAAIRAAKGE